MRLCAMVSPRLVLALLLVGGVMQQIACAQGARPAANVERGRYLVTSIMACGNCHATRNGTGGVVEGRELAGGGMRFDLPVYQGMAPNITPDRETGIGAWSDNEIKRALTHGERPASSPLAGVPLAPLMAVSFFKALTPADLDAVVAYLRSVPPVRHAVPPATRPASPPHQPYAEAERGFSPADLRDRVRRGAYLATIAHCMECHTPIGDKGGLLYDTALGTGGRAFLTSMLSNLPAGWSGATSRNITSDPVAGLGGWTDDEIKRAIAQGVGRDGRTLQAPMPFAGYATIAPEDLDALVAYLRTVPAKPGGGPAR
jgi:mono/diheme cytochrome c family protein